MIRITQQVRAEDAKRYYATADYYSEGQEIIGSWGGKGASRLGLEGTVEKTAFERLCDNLHPQTGRPLTVRTRSDRTVGYDFTFSVPKSVSLLYGLTRDEGILKAFREAVNETMREMEGEMQTRVRKGGKDENRVSGNMVWAEYIHTTSRPVDGVPDPQLHAHMFVFNSTWDEQERRWKAGQFRELKRDAPYFQAAFRVRLANKLQDISFGIQRKRDDFEISGIPADVLKRFSRRTALIEKLAEEKGISDPKEKAALGAKTREAKGPPLSWKELRKEWLGRLSEEERRTVASVWRREHVPDRLERGEAAAVDHAVEHSFVREAVVPERKIVTEALKRGLGAVTVEDVTRSVKNRPLIRSEVAGRQMATTKEMLALESKLVEFARDGRGRYRPLGDPNRRCSRDWLNAGQKEVLRATLASRDRISLIRGIAGSGKTTLLQELREAMAEVKKPIVAIAQSVKASREVLREKAGFAEANTVSYFLKDEEMQQSARGGVILVDEASLVGTRDVVNIFGVAEAVGARVVMVGDRRQHRSVSAGEPLRLLEEKSGLRPAEVTEIVRQKHKQYKKAAEALSVGNVEEAFATLNKLGWIHEVAGSERYQQLADAYLAAISEKNKKGEAKTAIVISPTHAECDSVVYAVRMELRRQGKLGEERLVDTWIPTHLTDAQKSDPTEYDPGWLVQFTQNSKGGFKKGARLIVGADGKAPVELANRFEVYRPNKIALAVGDRVQITAGGKTKDGKHRLSNGSLYTVQGFTARGDLVIDRGWVIARDFGHIAHGVAVTSHASQGESVDKCFVAMSSESFPAISQRSAYVALTRGEQEVRIFTDDRAELLKAASRPDEPLSALELAESVAKEPSLRKRLAKSLTAVRQRSGAGRQTPIARPNPAKSPAGERDMDHER